MNQYVSDNGSNLKPAPQSKQSAEGSNQDIDSTGEQVLLIPQPGNLPLMSPLCLLAGKLFCHFTSCPCQATVLTQALIVAAKIAWKRDYIGSYHAAMLRGINNLQCSTSFANSIALIQSSGCGKSRMVDEMAKLVFTIPINICNLREQKRECSVCVSYVWS